MIRNLLSATSIAAVLAIASTTFPASAQPDETFGDDSPIEPSPPPQRTEPAPVPPPTVSPPPPEANAVSSNAAAFGVGGQLALSGFGGMQVIYEMPDYHVDGLISFFDEADTTITIGGRFFWKVRRSERADFSLGAGIGFSHINDADVDILHIEAVGQIRAFLAPAVALSASFGVALQTLDGDAVGLGANLLGGAGITYFFR